MGASLAFWQAAAQDDARAHGAIRAYETHAAEADSADLLEGDFDDVRFETASFWALSPPPSPVHSLLDRSDGGLSMMASRREASPLILQLDVEGQHFFIRLREQPEVLSDSAVVRIHQEESGAVITRPVTGKTYTGERMVVISATAPQLLLRDPRELLMMREEREGVRVVDRPFGRFYSEASPRGDPTLIGGFLFEGHFFRVNSPNHPFGRQAALRLGGNSTATAAKLSNSLLISRHPLDDEASQSEAGEVADPGGKSPRRRYKCGNDLAHFNSHIGGATSFFANLLHKHHNITAAHSPMMAARRKTLASWADELEGDADASGCPASPQVLYVGVVADCAYMEAFKLDAAQARANIINDFNIVSAIYEDAFNVHLGILSIDLMMECSSAKSKTAFNVPCQPKISLASRLSRFTKWRLGQPEDAGLYHLVTGCGDSDVVGIAWLNQVCQIKPYTDSNGDYVGGTSVSAFIKNQFAIMAHEIGHNFGAVHDCDKQACQLCTGDNCPCCMCEKQCDCRGEFLMNPESGGLNVKTFSTCSRRDICKKMPVLASCLKEPGSLNTITKAMCGDGIKDDGEECDCGGPEKCKNNPCCTADCRLKPGARCSDGNDRCCRDCQVIPASAQHVCQKGKGPCQVSSVCDGEDADCPKLRYRADGEACDADGGRCASGLCTSRSRQCAAVGARLGITEDCPYEFGSCSIVCKNGENSCVILDATFVNGTSCGYGGKCYGGVCSEPAIQTFVMRNIVPLGLIGGAIVLFVILYATSAVTNIFRRRPPPPMPASLPNVGMIPQ